jgi:hypothetical protein
MNASQSTKAAYFNYIGSIELPLQIIEMLPRVGPTEDAIKKMRLLPEVIAELSELDPEMVRIELRLYGNWEEDDLKDNDDNLSKILWIAVTHIQRDHIF